MHLVTFHSDVIDPAGVLITDWLVCSGLSVTSGATWGVSVGAPLGHLTRWRHAGVKAAASKGQMAVRRSEEKKSSSHTRGHSCSPSALSTDPVQSWPRAGLTWSSSCAARSAAGRSRTVRPSSLYISLFIYLIIYIRVVRFVSTGETFGRNQNPLGDLTGLQRSYISALCVCVCVLVVQKLRSSQLTGSDEGRLSAQVLHVNLSNFCFP